MRPCIKLYIPKPSREDYFCEDTYNGILEYYEYICYLLKNQGFEITNE